MDDNPIPPLFNSAALLKKRPSIVDNDCDLVYLEDIMVQIHTNFYSCQETNPLDADVRTILPTLKSKILTGVHLLFSGVFPLGIEPYTHDMWRNAVLFGAVCHETICDEITHVIAAKVCLTLHSLEQ